MNTLIRRWLARLTLAWTGFGALCLPQASAQTDFYKGKTITIVVGFTPGGGYDLNARAIARFLGKHIPGNPTVVIQNMPGAGSLIAANYLANRALKDGTVIASFSRSTIFEPLLGNKSALFDPRQLSWIGSPGQEADVVMVNASSSVRSVQDLKNNKVVVGTTGSGADTAVVPLLLNSIFGTNIKIVSGYPGASEILLATERGEVDGIAGLSFGYLKASRPAWLAERHARLIMQFGTRPLPELDGLPSALDLAPEADRKLVEFFLARLTIAWPLAAPPNVPSDRLIALRQGFEATMIDQDYLREAIRQNIEVAPVSAQVITDVLNDVYAMPANIVERARAINDAAK